MYLERIVLVLFTAVTIFVLAVFLVKQYQPNNPPNTIGNPTSTQITTITPINTPVLSPTLLPSQIPTPTKVTFPTAPPISQFPQEKEGYDD